MGGKDRREERNFTKTLVNGSRSVEANELMLKETDLAPFNICPEGHVSGDHKDHNLVSTPN